MFKKIIQMRQTWLPEPISKPSKLGSWAARVSSRKHEMMTYCTYYKWDFGSNLAGVHFSVITYVTYVINALENVKIIQP